MANYCYVLPILAGGVEKMHGVDFSQPMQLNERVLNRGA